MRSSDWLPGYENSAPVRIGNAAVNQRQLDVYGEVIDALHLGRNAGPDPRPTRLVPAARRCSRFLEKHWDEPDEGIWEVRGPRRHFVHSKVMAWVAVDRAVQAVEVGHATARRSGGGPCGTRSTRTSARRATTRSATRSRSTTARRSSTRPSLLIPQVGFLPPDDPRVVGTVRAVQRELIERRAGAAVPELAGRTGDGRSDGLPGDEGAFLACSFWLADALHMIGRDEEATELFERLLTLRNDLGLLTEEYDPRYGRQVGNSPQAFSHVPLIQAALNLDRHTGAHCRAPGAHPADVQRHGKR